MNALPEIVAQREALVALRHDLHAHPELAFQEQRTSDRVAAFLQAQGIAVHRGLAGTGVVGVLKCGDSPRAIGLRADMDALPVREQNLFPHRSRHDGRMHACGHDGHTAMLLGAAQYLAAHPDFDGTVVFIFQPAEETDGGARVMIEQGLFQLYPVDAVFGMHNWPGLPAGQFAVHNGPVMACADQFDVLLRGHGAHAAMPHQGRDPLIGGGGAGAGGSKASSAARSTRSTRRCCRSRSSSPAARPTTSSRPKRASAAPCAPSSRKSKTPWKPPWNASAPASPPRMACRRRWITGAAIRRR